MPNKVRNKMTKKVRLARVTELYNDAIENTESFELSYGVSGTTPIGSDLLYLVGAIVNKTAVETTVSLRNYLNSYYHRDHWVWDYII